MVMVKEQAYNRRIRLFKWNAKLSENKLTDSQGLFVFLILNKFKSSTPDEIFEYSAIRLTRKVVPFELTRLSCKETIEALAFDVVVSMNQFLMKTAKCLGDEISEFLADSFCFSIGDTLIRPNGAKIVIVVEVHRSRVLEYDSDYLNSAAENHNDVGCALIPAEFPIFVSSKATEDEHLESEESDEHRESEESDDEPEMECRKDLLDILFTLKLAFEMPVISAMKPISSHEPLGLVQIPALEKIQTFDGSGSVENCSICMEGLSGGIVSVTSCSHIFHTGCIAQWLWMKQSCPMCRSLVS